MKQTFGILLMLIFFGCINSKENDISNPKNQKKEKQFESKIEYQPIFLNLNPNMNNSRFNEELSQSLPNKKFVLPIDKYNFEFSVKKKSNKIVLEYNNIKTLVFTPKFGDDAENRYLKFIEKEPIEKNAVIIKELITLFSNKYSKQLRELPLLKNQKGEYFNNLNGLLSERSIQNYDFKKENYLIFQDSIKTVIVGYTNAEYPEKLSGKALEKITYQIKTKEKEPLNPIISIEEVNQYFREFEKLSPYKQALKSTDFEDQIYREQGLSLEINYMINSDFELLVKKMQKSNNDFNSKLKEEDRLRKLKLEKEKTNLNRI
ncbi:hypothetical protein [Winogradskyella sp. MH6]|uniref:hypothetical protein n=1 Tax=Winogradskyella sp. MH6 TaxID=2929510 RepID=UPI001FB48D50|nr:hypothetical protein [Winogradskyella sp. MH6]